MRVLLVVHNFLPAHSAGTEVYTGELARELARRGHAVHVVTTEKDVARKHHSIREREWSGVRVTEIVNNLYYGSFRETWDDPRIERIFGELLERERPDVVHFQHLLYLSVGCVEEARRRAIPTLFTLHDFWLQCPRFGQRIHADGSICETIVARRCGECLTSFKFRQSALERVTGRVIASVNSAVGVDLKRVAQQAARSMRLAGAPSATQGDVEAARRMEAEVVARDAAMRERVIPNVSLFLAPSRFLRERLIEWGIPPDRIRYLRTGIDQRHFAATTRTQRAGSRVGKLRVAFFGTLAPHKGPQLLLEAWSRLSSELRERAQLELFGPALADASFSEALDQRAREVGATLRGALPREAVARELADIDLLVVPSVWYENAPLVILEALALRTPVLVSAIGGMAELVDDGRTGAHFRVGDVDDLARKLSELLGAPERLAGLFENVEPPQSFADDAERIEAMYEELRGRAAPERGA